MSPNIYVSEDFFENFDIEWAKLPQPNIYSTNEDEENKRKSINRIKDLMIASNIYSDVTDKSVVKYHTKQFGIYSSIKDLVFHTKVKDASYATRGQLKPRYTKEDCNKSGFCYFTNNDSLQCLKETQKTGKIVLGKDFLQTPFYLEHSFASESTNENINQIEKLKHPCTGIVIMDKYLFEDTSSRSQKIPNLILFLKELISPNLVDTFQVDIITENKSNNQLFDFKFNQILEAFTNKISLHIYAPSVINQEADRYLITNYAVFAIGHPFDRSTNVSCNFFPSNTSVDPIKKSYQLWFEKISLALKIIKKTPDKIGLVKSIWKSDNSEHSIFNF